MEYFLIIRGPLGSGKSTIATRASEVIGAEYVGVDKLLEEMKLDFRPPGYDSIPIKHFIKVNDFIVDKAKESSVPMVVDACFYHQSVLEDLLERMPCKGIVFTLKAPLEICIERDSSRKKTHGPGAATAVHNLVSRFDYGNIIDVTNPVEESVQKIVSNLPK